MKRNDTGGRARAGAGGRGRTPGTKRNEVMTFLTTKNTTFSSGENCQEFQALDSATTPTRYISRWASSRISRYAPERGKKQQYNCNKLFRRATCPHANRFLCPVRVATRAKETDWGGATSRYVSTSCNSCSGSPPHHKGHTLKTKVCHKGKIARNFFYTLRLFFLQHAARKIL